MYRGFDLNLEWNKSNDDKFYETGEEIFKLHQSEVQNTLENFVSDDGALDGSSLQSNWFPQVEADIFISHSHQDRKRAIALAGWLYTAFNLKSFIDSCIWGYADNLIKLIDDKHCYKPKSKTYDYKLRNYSTSHVHMMLTTALNMMIDNAECLIFLNTPNSISANDIINRTASPWIYSEIATTKTIRQRIPKRRLINESKKFSKGGVVNERLEVQYDLDLSHLSRIDTNNLIKWEENKTPINSSHPLDILYSLNPITSNFFLK